MQREAPVQGPSDPPRAAPGAPTQRVIEFFESLCPASLPRIGQIYRADASFKDPFNEVTGVDAITAIFRHMFETTEDPRFTVLDVIDDAGQCFLTWNFHFRSIGLRRRDWMIHGASRIEFDSDGLVRRHRDYWDAAEEFYEALPLLGAVLRTIKRQLRAAARESR
ncbi:snoaL-like domain protein [mine drainage metagenome]|jgi:hypothetical protein|uniref:SnoaL-like domain protein n=1 Tax=mine drainage metagenome TaxID=410659 RepID=A0A1J5QZM3_9ZZZZ